MILKVVVGSDGLDRKPKSFQCSHSQFICLTENDVSSSSGVQGINIKRWARRWEAGLIHIIRYILLHYKFTNISIWSDGYFVILQYISV